MSGTIEHFEGPYAFLSNFYRRPVTVWGITFPTAEHAFHYAKTYDAEEKAAILAARSPAEAKQLGRHCNLRVDWEQAKDYAMLEVVRAKFDDPELAAKLLDTGDAELVEGNHWGDQYWGVCRGRGLNKLGKILMQVRAELLAAETAIVKDPEFIEGVYRRADRIRNLPLASVLRNFD